MIAGLWCSNHLRVWSGSPKGGGGGVVRWAVGESGPRRRGARCYTTVRRWAAATAATAAEKNPGQHGGSRDEILPGGAEGKGGNRGRRRRKTSPPRRSQRLFELQPFQDFPALTGRNHEKKFFAIPELLSLPLKETSVFLRRSSRRWTGTRTAT